MQELTGFPTDSNSLRVKPRKAAAALYFEVLTRII